MKFSPLEKVFVMTPSALFFGVVTECRSIERPAGNETSYLVRHLDAVATIAELVCSEDQLLTADAYSFDITSRWLRSVGKPAETFADDLIAHVAIGTVEEPTTATSTASVSAFATVGNG